MKDKLISSQLVPKKKKKNPHLNEIYLRIH